jgi:hypothetical protein
MRVRQARLTHMRRELGNYTEQELRACEETLRVAEARRDAVQQRADAEQVASASAADEALIFKRKLKAEEKLRRFFGSGGESSTAASLRPATSR